MPNKIAAVAISPTAGESYVANWLEFKTFIDALRIDLERKH